MPLESGTTKVKFELWWVLAFLVTITFLGGMYLFNVQASDREKIQFIKEDVIILKQQFKNIDDKLANISATMEKISEAFARHQSRSEPRNERRSQ